MAPPFSKSFALIRVVSKTVEKGECGERQNKLSQLIKDAMKAERRDMLECTALKKDKDRKILCI